MNKRKKSGTYNPVPPSPSNFNKDVRNNEIMKVFNDIKEKQRMEVVSQFDLNTFPSVLPKMRK